jgi:hypothetical protein
VIALITMVVAAASWRGWLKGHTRALLRGEGLVSPMLPCPELGALRRRSARAAARPRGRISPCARARTRNGRAERLRSLLRTQLRGDQVIVVSNREPYIHERTTAGVVVRARPVVW